MCVYLTHLRDLKTFLSSICLVNAQGINPKDVRGFSGLASHVEKMVQDLPHIEILPLITMAVSGVGAPHL
jgi:hypothetical protein